MTGNYKIHYECGKLIIDPLPITVITHDMEWVYDGQAHGWDGHHVSESTPLVAGHRSEADILFTITNVLDGYGFLESIVSSLGCGLGFLLAMVLFSGLRSRIDESEIPAPFRGLAVTLIAASFISLAFFGFAGIVDNLFA